MKEMTMQNEFCPDCGHMLASLMMPCQFCGWSDHAAYFGNKDFDPEMEDDSAFWIVEDADNDENIWTR
jgi:hypothetical protein